MYISKSIKVYLDDLAARKAAPGGGSAAALSASLGVALIEMMINYTIGNPRYKDVEPEMEEMLKEADELRLALESLVDRDISEYRKVSEARKMPKEVPEERDVRDRSIQDALKHAVAVPMEICKCASHALKLCPALLQKGNIYLSSDAGVASELLAASFNSALLNVDINLRDIEDEQFVLSTRTALEALEKEASTIRRDIWNNLKEEKG